MNCANHRSDNDCLIPVVETSGSQECVGGTCKVLFLSYKPFGNDQAHFMHVKMPAICGMRQVVVQLNENTFMRTDSSNE
jgi:hypothetical protein